MFFFRIRQAGLRVSLGAIVIDIRLAYRSPPTVNLFQRWELHEAYPYHGDPYLPTISSHPHRIHEIHAHDYHLLQIRAF